MLSAADRSHSRRDTAALLVCAALSFVVLLTPEALGRTIASSLRDTVLAPLTALQSRAAEGRTSRVRFAAVTAQRDSAALAAQAMPVLEAENVRLRRLLGLGPRIALPHRTAEVLHQSQATDGRMLLLDIGEQDGAAPFQPVLAPEGLLGVVAEVSTGTATVMTWSHPDFRVSAYTAGGQVFGMVAPAGGGAAVEAGLEFRAASYRDTLALGTTILSSGLGGVYPKGIPIGTVTGVAREQEGWERVYALQPAANPSAVAHVMVLTGAPAAALDAAFPSESILAAVAADSARRAMAADSALRVRIADSVKASLRDSLQRAAAAAAPASAAAPPASRPPVTAP
jgi:rod shape-determining protein MreC